MTLDVVLHCVACTLTLVAMQRDARIESDSILVVFPALCPCVWSCKIGLELIIFAHPKFYRVQRDVLCHVVNLPLGHNCYSSLNLQD